MVQCVGPHKWHSGGRGFDPLLSHTVHAGEQSVSPSGGFTGGPKGDQRGSQGGKLAAQGVMAGSIERSSRRHGDSQDLYSRPYGHLSADTQVKITPKKNKRKYEVPI